VCRVAITEAVDGLAAGQFADLRRGTLTHGHP
jgi:hypothetical protein